MKQIITLALLLLFSCVQEQPKPSIDEIKSPVAARVSDTINIPKKKELQEIPDNLKVFESELKYQWQTVLSAPAKELAILLFKNWINENKPNVVDSFNLISNERSDSLKLYVKDTAFIIKLQSNRSKRGVLNSNRSSHTKHNLLEEDPYGKGKPIIYLYPEEEIKVSVELQFNGKLTYTYPTYPEDGWRVTAHPDGRLVDAEGKEYYSLFWEGYSSESGELPSGFVVHRDSVNSFLDEKLTILGLNYRERQEFIVFWAPVLMTSEYSTVHFATDEYVKRVPLVVSPKPDTQIRVMMYFKKSRLGEELKGQELVPVTRRGFTVVEWGGCNLDKPVRHYN